MQRGRSPAYAQNQKEVQSSTDTEQEEDTYKRRKKEKIAQLRAKLDAEIARRADRFSSSSSSQDAVRQEESSKETEVREDILNRVVKGLNRERRETARLQLSELNAKLSAYQQSLKEEGYRDAELLEMIDVPHQVLEELDSFGGLKESDLERIAFW